MAFILNIETSSTICSVSISEKEKCILLKEENKGFTHAESLFVFLQDLFRETDIHMNKLSAISVSSGPGSYTGLRIGASVAKGFCYALNIPLIAIPTLLIQANDYKLKNMLQTSDLICSMSDARRMEVYQCLYDSNLTEKYSARPNIVDVSFLQEYLVDNKVYFIGNTNEKVKQIVQHKNAYFIENILPSSQKMCELSIGKYLNKQFEDIAYFEPIYLKEGVLKK